MKKTKTVMTIMFAVIIAMTLFNTAFAADTAVEVAPAIEVEAISETFCLNHSKNLKETDIGSAIWADEYATYTADGSGVIMVYFDKEEYVCGKCYPETVDTNDGIGSAIWLSPIGAITADGDGVQRVYLIDGYVCADCMMRAQSDIGSAIWADEFATYTADGSGVITVYFNNDEYICGKCHPEVVDVNDGLGSAIWCCPIGTITANGDGVQRVYLIDGYVCTDCGNNVRCGH